MNSRQSYNLDDYISPEEREHFLYLLHRYLVWVGEKIPDEIEIDGETIKLHELIWRCIHKKQFSEQEKKRIMELVHILEKKEKHDEEILKNTNLTKRQKGCTILQLSFLRGLFCFIYSSFCNIHGNFSSLFWIFCS